MFTVDQALDKLPSIYAEVMRLVRDGFTPSPTSARSGSSADPSSAGSSTNTSEPRRSPGQVW